MEKLKVFTKYQLRKQGAGFSFDLRDEKMKDCHLTDSNVAIFNNPIDETIEFNKIQRKENERLGRKVDFNLRPISSCIYYVEDKEATKALHGKIKAE